jgi:tetratricopeptide (TPR) repeat protein
MGEPTLLILDEIYSAPKDESQADFAVILDTEPYGGQEAADTLTRLGQHFTHSLIFSRSQASFSAVLTLGARLPLNLLYINTHGFAQGIQLGAQLPETFGSDSEDEGERVQMDNFKISQWLTMPTRPVVINNSCLSWIGVGRAFLASGARGYLGTLWAVDASPSAQLASHVLGLALQEDRPLAEALAMTPADSFTKEAYILIGTLRTSVAHAGPAQGSLSQSRLTEAVTVLLECLEAAGRDQRRFDLVAVLYSNYRVALEQLLNSTADGKNPLAAINDIYLKELRVLLSMTVNTLQVDQRERELIETMEAGLLPSGHGPEADLIVPNHMTLRRELLFLKSMYYSRHGNVTTALGMLEDSAGNDEMVSVEQLLLLSSLYRSLAEITKALFHASHAVILGRRNGNRSQLVKALGHHVQLLYRVEEYEQADAEALEAIDLARKLEDRHEEVTLLQDRVSILFGLHEDQKALEMALESLRCARSFHDDLAETASLGLITIALMRLGDLPHAREAAEGGLQLACDLGDPHQQAEFLMDLGRISALEEQPAHAVDAFLKAMQLYREQGNGEKAIVATKSLFDAYVQMGSLNQAVLQLEQLPKAMDGMSDNLRTPTTDFITTSLKRIAAETPVEDARSVIHDLWQRMMNRYAMKPPHWHANFVCNVCAVMEFWLDGLQDKAVEVAACLDEDSQNYFDFASFVANPRLPSGASSTTGGYV